MSASYPTVCIGDVCDVGDGAHSKVKRLPGGVLYLTSKNIGSGQLVKLDKVDYISEEDFERLFPSESRATRRPRSGDVLIGIIGTFGNAYLYKDSDNFGFSSSIAVLRPQQEKLLPEFLYYVVSSRSFKSQHAAHNAGSVQGYTNIPTIKGLSLPLPSFEVQRKVAFALKTLDDKIQLNHQINQTLEQMAQATFKSWFVDFEPVKAKIAALEAGGSEEDALLAAIQAISGKDKQQLTCLQTEQPEQYAKLRATAELFPSAMQDSELGEIPEGWDLSQIGDEVSVVGGGTPSTKNPEFWNDSEFHWTTPKDLSNIADKVLIDTERKVSPIGLAKISSGLLPVDTVLMSSRAPVGYLALAKVPVAVNQGYIAMKCEKQLTPEFVIQWCGAHMDEIKSRASGTTFAEISKKNFKVIPLVVPSEAIVKAYSECVRALYAQIESNVRVSQTLSELRDSLLPRLLSGELQLMGSTSEPEYGEPANA